MSEKYTWKILQDGLSFEDIGIADWGVWSGETPYSSGYTSTLALTGLTFKENNNRCHNIRYSIMWDDNSGNTAIGTAIMSACTPPPSPLVCYDIISTEGRLRVPCRTTDTILHLSAEPKSCFEDETLEILPTNEETEEYTYSIKINGKTPDSEGNFSGNCSGETEVFKAWCLNTQNFDRFGTWTVYDYDTGYIEHGPSDITDGTFEYTFIENTTNNDTKYRIVFESECIGSHSNESAETIYTVTASDDCIPCEAISGVDFELSSETLWAQVNLEACRIYSGGNYYAWADSNGLDVSEASAFTLSSYTYYDKETSAYTVYNDQDGLRIIDKRVYDNEWTVPTPYHFQELAMEVPMTSDSTKFIFSKQFEGEERPREMVIPKIGGYLHDNRSTSTATPYFWTSYMSGDTIASAVTCYVSGSSLNYKVMPRYYGLQIRLVKEKTNSIQFLVNSRPSESATKTVSVTFRMKRTNVTANTTTTEMVTLPLQLEWNKFKTVKVSKIYESNANVTWVIDGAERVIDNLGNVYTNISVRGSSFTDGGGVTITIN